jgi:O-antigen/teichoic acid export membrane protein
MLLLMVVSLYTSRVVLSMLGVIDNGIYNIVGGAVGMFSFLNGALSGATSRFLTYELARDDKERLKLTFVSALWAHILVALLVLILLETVGLWFVNHKLDIPSDRMNAARVAFHLSVVASMISITQVPYSASLISHERMGAFAYMSLLEAGLKLAICYLVIKTPFDRLISYAVLILIIKVLIQSIYRFYCIRHFHECRLIKVKDGTFFKPILSFSVWDLLGNLSVVARNQGIDIVLNMFFGPAINSAAGLAGTAGGAVHGFATNFLTAIRPPILKSYAIGDYAKMEELMITASRFSYSLLALLSVPFFFESQFIMNIWLKNPPDHTALFCAIGLAEDLVAAIFLPLVFAIHASGNIRRMSIISGCIWLLSVPISYALLALGVFPEVCYLVRIGLLFLIVPSNLYITKKNIPAFDVPLYLRKTIVKILPASAIVLVATFLIYRLFPGMSWQRFIATGFTSSVMVCLTSLFIIFDKQTRVALVQKISRFISRKNA